jgi:hypothetical protein
MRLCSYNSGGSTRYAAVKGNLTKRIAPKRRTLDDFIAAIGTLRNVVEAEPNGHADPARSGGVGAAALRLGEIPGVASIASA